MKNTLIIIGGIILGLLILGGLWWYLLLNGRPASLADIPNPFGTSDETAFTPTTIAPDPTTEPRVFDTALRKISEGPVAGATFVEEDGRTFIYFAERGTGHLFVADTETGTTTRISNVTLPRTTDAVWSPDGTHVALTTEVSAGVVRTYLGTLTTASSTGETTLSTVELSRSVHNIAFSNDGTQVFYTVGAVSGSTGYSQDLANGARSVRFTTPLRNTIVSWEPSITLASAPSASVKGYVYGGASLTRLFGGVNGLMAIPTKNGYVVSYLDNGSLVSRAGTPGGTPLAITAFPEKCTPDTQTSVVLWCAAPIALPSGIYPDAWYQGTVSFEDIIWQVNTEIGSATLVSIPSEDVDEPIDAIHMQVGGNSKFLLFINKRDGALWLQETA